MTFSSPLLCSWSWATSGGGIGENPIKEEIGETIIQGEIICENFIEEEIGENIIKEEILYENLIEDEIRENLIKEGIGENLIKEEIGENLIGEKILDKEEENTEKYDKISANREIWGQEKI